MVETEPRINEHGRAILYRREISKFLKPDDPNNQEPITPRELAKLFGAKEYFAKNGLSLNMQPDEMVYTLARYLSGCEKVNFPRKIVQTPEPIVAAGFRRRKGEEIAPRTKFFIDVLTDLNIEYDSIIGKANNYYAFVVGSLNKIVLVPNITGVTFVINRCEGPDDWKVFASLSSNKLKLLAHKGLITIVADKVPVEWKKSMRTALMSPNSRFEGNVEDILAEFEEKKAPDNYYTERNACRKLHISNKKFKKAIHELRLSGGLFLDKTNDLEIHYSEEILDQVKSYYPELQFEVLDRKKWYSTFRIFTILKNEGINISRNSGTKKIEDYIEARIQELRSKEGEKFNEEDYKREGRTRGKSGTNPYYHKKIVDFVLEEIKQDITKKLLS